MSSLPDPGRQLPRYLTQAEVAAFFGAVRSVRDRALFALVYHYGLRVSEVALLERQDVDLARSRLVVKRVKGGLWTERPLFGSTERLLRGYLAALPSTNGTTALFPGKHGPLQKRQIQSLFVRYRDQAGIAARVGVHSLRHSIATHLLDAGASLEFVQDHLGHRNIRSTSIYARITDQHRALVFQRLDASPWIVHPATEDTGGNNGKEEIR